MRLSLLGSFGILLVSPQVCLSWVTITNIGSVSTKKGLTLFGSNWADMDDPSDFPISLRTALIEKAKQLDENLERGDSKGSYSPSGWSNRLGSVLTPVSIPGVYTGDRPFMWNNIDVGGRMTVIQLPNSDGGNDLWVHSPVELDGPLMKALDKLGTVKYVISPNYEHLKYASQWANAYPEANIWGCPGLIERMEDVKFSGEIPYNFRPGSWSGSGSGTTTPQQLDNCWDLDEIQPLHINIEVNPFTGNPFFNEVIFYHKASKSLLTTDLYWNYPQKDGVPNSNLLDSPISAWELAPAVDKIPRGTRLWKFGMDKIYHPFYNNFMIQSKPEYKEIVEFILKGDWEIETLIPCHGDIIRGKDLVTKTLKDFLEL